MRIPRWRGGELFRMQSRADKLLELRSGYWEARDLGATHKEAKAFALVHYRSMQTHKKSMDSMREVTRLYKEITKAISRSK